MLKKKKKTCLPKAASPRTELPGQLVFELPVDVVEDLGNQHSMPSSYITFSKFVGLLSGFRRKDED